MQAEAKVIIFNKSSVISTVTYTNWTDNTSKSIQILPGTTFITYNWYEEDPEHPGSYIATSENILNLSIRDNSSVLTKVLLSDFAYDNDKVSITLVPGSYSL